MKKRIITGICVALFWIALLIWAPTWCLFPVLLVVMWRCLHEYNVMLKNAKLERSPLFLLLAGTAWLIECYKQSNWGFLLIVTVLFILFLRVLLDPKVGRPIEMLGTTLLGFIYIPFMLGFFLFLAQFQSYYALPQLTREGIYLAAFVALVTKAGDVGAYAVGMAFGKHKMCPRISPKKTWEGLAGGLALSAALGAGFVWLAQNKFNPENFMTLRHFSLLEAALVGLVLCAIGVFGDLIESQLKRATQIKDSGHFLPGMGGLLDVFDSLMFTPAAFYFYLLATHQHGRIFF